MKVATETADQVELRLLRVLAQARFEILADDYIWQPLTSGTPPSRDAIACVRDGDVWHEFAPVQQALVASAIGLSASTSAKLWMLPDSSRGWRRT